MMNVTQNERKARNLSSESLITLERMAAAVKAVQGQGREDHHKVSIVSCEETFESDMFQSKLAYVVQKKGL